MIYILCICTRDSTCSYLGFMVVFFRIRSDYSEYKVLFIFLFFRRALQDYYM